MKSAFALYEKFETEKLRPPVAGDFLYGLRLFVQDEAAALQSGGITLVYPRLTSDINSAIKKLEAAAKIQSVYGIVLNLSNCNNPQPIYKAAQELINNSRLVATVADCKTAAMPFMKSSALLLEGEELAIREALARAGLSKRYQKAPVFLNTQKKELLKCAEGWHVYAAAGSAEYGPRLALRRITFPKKLSCMGAMPLRIWLQNTGTSAEYRKLTLKLYINADNRIVEIPLKTKLKRLEQGDATINEIALLPAVMPGTYPLLCEMFANNTPIKLCNSCKEENGIYTLGEICIDNVKRDELFNPWHNYYPEGYYPLEDPKLPY